MGYEKKTVYSVVGSLTKKRIYFKKVNCSGGGARRLRRKESRKKDLGKKEKKSRQLKQKPRKRIPTGGGLPPREKKTLPQEGKRIY